MPDTTTEISSTTSLRAAFVKLRRNATTWATKAEWMQAVSTIAAGNGESPTADQWVEAAEQAETACDKCKGRGEYYWGGTINGKPLKQGLCYHCEGKGRMNQDDYRRCYGALMGQIRHAAGF
jgi:hypothetical protein